MAVRNCHGLRAIANCDNCVFHICRDVDFEFDPAKDAINRAKHQLPLSFGQRIFDDPLVAILPSLRPMDGEDRYKAVGIVDGKLFTAIYVERGAATRLISVRRSNGR